MRRQQADGAERAGRHARSRVATAVVVALGLLAGACGTGSSGDRSAATSSPPTTAPAPVTTPAADGPTTAPTGDPATTAAPPAAFDARVVLERLVIDDRPSPQLPYRRDDWPHWADIDGNGCEAREDALIAASLEPPELGPACKVLSGEWVSPYDGVVTTDPAAIQIDHLVPLAEAHRSGGWRWNVDRRRLFANDQAELVPASAASNQSKSDKTPDQWRPAAREVWCTYALAWARVKTTYDLTVTTSERDALGQMLDTCPPDAPQDGSGVRWASGAR